MIGRDLAEDLGAAEGSKVVLSFQDINNELVSAAFRVAGIFKVSDKSLNEGVVFVRKTELTELIEANAIHQVSVWLNDKENAEVVAQSLDSTLGTAKARDWQLISPEMAYMMDYSGTVLWIYMGIILFGLAFGLINTMLMAVLERTKEIGMLMAIGMNKTRVFFMILMETIFLSLVGAIIGIAISIVLVASLQSSGLNLSMAAEGMNAIGYSEIIYPVISTSEYIQIIFMVIGVAVLGSIYPAIKALRLHPSEALSTL